MQGYTVAYSHLLSTLDSAEHEEVCVGALQSQVLQHKVADAHTPATFKWAESCHGVHLHNDFL